MTDPAASENVDFTDTERILHALNELAQAVNENRTLLNDLVGRLNEVEAELQLVRSEVKSQATSITHLESSIQFLTMKHRGKLTPLPQMTCEEKNDA